MTPVGCEVGPPITGQLTLEGIPVLGLVDTGASVTCLGFAIWWCYRAQWGPLKPFEGTVHGAHGKPLQIAGKTQHLDLQWGEARGRACFIVIVGLESPPCLIGMDIMRPLRIHIDVTNGTATPAQPDPQTVHLNAAQQRMKQPLPRVVPPAILTHGKLSTSRPYRPLRWPLRPPPLPSHQPPLCPHMRRHPLPLTPLAVLCCSKLRRFQQKPPDSSDATTRGPPRTSYSVQRTLCLPL